MILGAIIAGYESFDSNMFGYLLIWGNNFFQAIYNVFTSKFNENKTLTAFEINFYFAAIGLPLMTIITTYMGDIQTLYDVFFSTNKQDSLAIMVLLSGSFGICITITSLLTVTVCGPLAINIAGTIKDVGLTYAGFLFFEDVKASSSVMIGLGFSFAGAIFVSYDKYKQSQKQTTP